MRRRIAIGLLIFIVSIMLTFNTSNATIGSNSKLVLYFDNINVTEGSVRAIEGPTITGTSNTEIKYSVEFNEPGEYYEFTVDIVNAGSEDAMVSDIEGIELTEEQKKFLEYSLTYADNGTEIKPKDKLASGATEKLRIRIEFKKDVAIDDLPSQEYVLSLTQNKAFYVQADDTAVDRHQNGDNDDGGNTGDNTGGNDDGGNTGDNTGGNDDGGNTGDNTGGNDDGGNTGDNTGGNGDGGNKGDNDGGNGDGGNKGDNDGGNGDGGNKGDNDGGNGDGGNKGDNDGGNGNGGNKGDNDGGNGDGGNNGNNDGKNNGSGNNADNSGKNNGNGNNNSSKGNGSDANKDDSNSKGNIISRITKNAKTGDNIIEYVVILALSVIAFIITKKKLKKEDE